MVLLTMGIAIITAARLIPSTALSGIPNFGDTTCQIELPGTAPSRANAYSIRALLVMQDTPHRYLRAERGRRRVLRQPGASAPLLRLSGYTNVHRDCDDHPEATAEAPVAASLLKDVPHDLREEENMAQTACSHTRSSLCAPERPGCSSVRSGQR